MRSPEMRKKRRLRSVCAPHRRAAGTSIGPKLSFSVLAFSMGPAMPAVMLRQVEYQDFGLVAFGERERALVGLERIACLQALAIHGDRAARDMHISLAAPRKLVLRALGTVEQAGVDAGILMD